MKKAEDDMRPEYDFSRGVRGKYAGKEIRVVSPSSSDLSARGEGADEFEAAYDEKFTDTLNLDTWTLGEDLAAAFGRLEQEVSDALKKEDDYRRQVRKIVFPELRTMPDAPPNAGVWQARASDLERIHTGLLFNGGVEACDGTSVVHDTLPLTITQIGVCLVSYQGQQGSWAHRLFRRDLRAKVKDPVDEVLTALKWREKRGGQGQEEDNDETLSGMARRGIMAYAERAILREKSTAPWRMGHGSPIPHELFRGLWSSKGERIKIALDLIRWYALEHKKFIFVPSAPAKRHLLMLGNALRPLEFAIIQTLKPEIDYRIKSGHYRDESGVPEELKRFSKEVGPQMIVGVYRVWEAAPPFLFYAHVEHAEMAAHIAMADSLLQEHRGFPMLIDLADTVCAATFGVDDFRTSVHTAYADAGEPFRYLGERETRSR
ncbi:MAG TPA: hypothetical protein VD861_17185 [Pyrinomonadaceae bacterium]|nr:hypothetical protein [Pyrinomonadaceae bacterium]